VQPFALLKTQTTHKNAHPNVNKTDGNMTHPAHPIHPVHPLHPLPHEQKDHKEHKSPGKNLRGHGHHQKPAPKPAEPEENNESEEAQVNEEESVVAEQGEDAEEVAAARLLADKKAKKTKRGAPRRGHKKGGKHGNKKHHHTVKPEDIGENAEGVIGGEDAEDIEHELRRLLGQIHQGNNDKKQVHAAGKKGGRPHWKKPAHVKPELKPEDFDFFGEHHIFGEDAFENGEGFGFDWNHHHRKH
jgi:hypothetical protein